MHLGKWKLSALTSIFEIAISLWYFGVLYFAIEEKAAIVSALFTHEIRMIVWVALLPILDPLRIF